MIIKMQYHKDRDTFTYHSDDPDVTGDCDNPTITFRDAGTMEFRCDNSDGVELRFYKVDPADWQPQPPSDEGYYEFVDDGTTCLRFHNHHCHLGETKLTLKLECRIDDDDWKRKDSDPIVVNMPPT